VLTLSSLRQPGPNHWTKQVQRLGWWAPHRLQESGLHYSSFFLPWVTQHHHWTSRVAEAGGAHPINQETLGPKKLSLTLPGQPPWQTRAGQNSHESHYLWAGIIDPLELIFFILKKSWTDLMNWNELGSINLWFFLKNQNRHLKSGEKDVDWFRSSIKRILIFVLRSTGGSSVGRVQESCVWKFETRIDNIWLVYAACAGTRMHYTGVFQELRQQQEEFSGSQVWSSTRWIGVPAGVPNTPTTYTVYQQNILQIFASGLGMRGSLCCCEQGLRTEFFLKAHMGYPKDTEMHHGSKPLTRSKISEISQWQKSFPELKISSPRISCTWNWERRSSWKVVWVTKSSYTSETSFRWQIFCSCSWRAVDMC